MKVSLVRVVAVFTMMAAGLARAEPSLTVQGTNYPAGSVVNEWAQYTIQTSGTVSVRSGANVSFSTSNLITLYPGFNVELGGVFSAKISASPGYNPGGYYNTITPTLVLVSGDQQYGQIGQFNLQPFDVAVWNAAGTAPLANAPVLLTVNIGGGWLSTTNDANAVLSKNLQLITDGDGTVHAYYQQSSTAGVTSYIQVVAGTQIVQFTTYSTLDVTAPSVPAGLIASNLATTSFTLSWNASTDNFGVAGYEIFKNGALIGTSTSLSYAVSNLTPGTVYNMTVKARDAANNVSAASTALPVTTLTPPDVAAPSAPTNLVSGSITTTSFTLGWTASTDNVGVVDYLVYKNGTQVGDPVTTTSSGLGGLSPSTAYSMMVKARDAAGNISAASETLIVTTQAAAPSTEAWEIAFFGATGVNFSANPDGDALTNLQEYQQGRHPLVGDDGVSLYVDAALGNDTSYNGRSVWPGMPTAAHGPKASLTAAINAAATGDTILILSNPSAYPATVLSPVGKDLVLRLVGNVSIHP